VARQLPRVVVFDWRLGVGVAWRKMGAGRVVPTLSSLSLLPRSVVLGRRGVESRSTALWDG